MKAGQDFGQTFGSVAQLALRGWADRFAQPRYAWQEHDYAQGRQWALCAPAAIAGRQVGRFHFETSLVISRSDDDQEFAQTSRHWRLDFDGGRLRMRRWLNHADQVGASQVGELDVAGTPADILPTALADWWPSLQSAFVAPNALHRAQAEALAVPDGDSSEGADAAGRRPTASPRTASSSDTDWRGMGLYALLIIVGTPFKIAYSIGDHVHSAWRRLRGRI